jgi:hypothetical protein
VSLARPDILAGDRAEPVAVEFHPDRALPEANLPPGGAHLLRDGLPHLARSVLGVQKTLDQAGIDGPAPARQPQRIQGGLEGVE